MATSDQRPRTVTDITGHCGVMGGGVSGWSHYDGVGHVDVAAESVHERNLLGLGDRGVEGKFFFTMMDPA